MSRNARFLLACLFSGLCLAGAWVVFMLATGAAQGVSPPVSAFKKLVPLVAVVALVLQLLYGGALSAVLQPRGLFTLPVLILAYVVPIGLVGLKLADTTSDVLGIVPWLLFGLVLACSFWAVMRLPAR